MAYCTVEDVEQLMQVVIKQAGTPDRAAALEIVEDTAAELDGIAQAAGYEVPVTGTQAVALMKRYNRMCAAVAVWHAGFVSDNAPARVEYWNEQCEGFKTRLRKGEQELPGLEPLSDIDPAFGISTFPNRDRYWTTRVEDETY